MCFISVLKNVEMNVDNAEDCGGDDIRIVVVQGSKRCTIKQKDAYKVKLVFQGVELLLPFCACFFQVHNHCTEVHFSSFFSGGFITAIVVNPPESTSVHRFKSTILEN